MVDLNAMNITALLGGTAAIGLIISAWSQIRNFLRYAASLCIVTSELRDGTSKGMLRYCMTHYYRIPLGSRAYDSAYLFFKSRNKELFCGTEIAGETTCMFIKWNWHGPLTMSPFLPIIITRKKLDKGEPQPYSMPVSVTYCRYMFNIEKILIAAMEELTVFRENEKKSLDRPYTRFRISYRYGSGGRSEDQMKVEASLSEKAPGNAANNENIRDGTSRLLGFNKDDIGERSPCVKPYITYLSFPEEIYECVREVQYWKDSKEWYKERAIPWKRGWLLYGKPGTGKSALTRALAEKLDLPLIVWDLSSFTNREFSENWRQMARNDGPCIALIEDIDNIFEGRTNVKQGSNRETLSFDCLLNTIDGVDKDGGVLTVITTNKAETLDDALGKPNGVKVRSTRPGRIDRVMELGNMDEPCRKRLVERILDEWPEHWDRLVKESDGETPAQVQDRCARLALKLYWQKHEVPK